MCVRCADADGANVSDLRWLAVCSSDCFLTGRHVMLDLAVRETYVIILFFFFAEYSVHDNIGSQSVLVQ